MIGIFQFWSNLTYAAVARSFCDSWATCYVNYLMTRSIKHGSLLSTITPPVS